MLLDAENPNESSIVLAMEVGEVKVLLTGDISSEIELALVARGLIEDIDVLKVAHHGSKTSSEKSFLDIAKPEVALISAGADNTYGHPHPFVLSRLKERGALIKRTDTQGTVELVINKGTIFQERIPWLPEWVSDHLALLDPVIP